LNECLSDQCAAYIKSEFGLQTCLVPRIKSYGRPTHLPGAALEFSFVALSLDLKSDLSFEALFRVCNVNDEYRAFYSNQEKRGSMDTVRLDSSQRH
jgi:hypothetical protein